MAEPPSNSSFTLNLPSKYAPSKSNKTGPQGSSPSAPLDFLARTWTVTHSTLKMWRSARNVRITYTVLPSSTSAGNAAGQRLDDLVEYEPTKQPAGHVKARVKAVNGVDTMAADGGWNWRGKGWLFWVTSHWELLGWGETKNTRGEVERWAVTWFAKTPFTQEGIDVYTDKKEAISDETYAAIKAALGKLDAKELVEMVQRDMFAIEVRLPWGESK